MRRVGRDDFRAKVEAHSLPQAFPGVRGFGFIQRVPRDTLAAFIAAERADGAPQFALRQLELALAGRVRRCCLKRWHPAP